MTTAVLLAPIDAVRVEARALDALAAPARAREAPADAPCERAIAWQGSDDALRRLALRHAGHVVLAMLVPALLLALALAVGPGVWASDFSVSPAIFDEPALLAVPALWLLSTILAVVVTRCRAKVELRRGIWGAVRIDGAPLAYTGTLRELLMPLAAIAAGLAAVAAGLALAKWLAMPRPRLTPSPWRFLATIPLVYVLGISAWHARAYLASRTALRGVAGCLHGSRFRYAGAHLGWALALGLTLGLALPWRQMALQRRLIAGMTLGRHRFTFDGDGACLVRRLAVAWGLGLALYLATVVAIALTPVGHLIAVRAQLGVWLEPEVSDLAAAVLIGLAAAFGLTMLAAWYRIGALRQFAAATRMDGRRLNLEAATGDYLRLAALNLLIKAGSLMLLAPLADLRHARFLVERLRVDGARVEPPLIDQRRAAEMRG